MGEAPEEVLASRQCGSKTTKGLTASWQRGLVCLALAGAALAVFWPVLGCDFINYDDPAYFSANRRVLSGLSWSNVLWACRTTDNASWYPLSWLSFLLDATLFGKGPAGPHLTNLLIHAANTVLLFLLLRRMTGAQWRSALVAALFALHPLAVEPVAWVSERKGLLCAFFGLLTLLAYARYVETKDCQEKPGCRPRSRRDVVFSCSAAWYCLALALFAFSLLSKPALAALPGAMLLLDYWPLGRPELKAMDSKLRSFLPLVMEKVPFLVIGLLSSAATIRVHKTYGALVTLSTSPIASRIEAAFVSYARYLENILWPIRLALPYPDPGRWPWTLILAGVALVAGLSLLALESRRRRPYLLPGLGWFVGLLLPVIGIIGWGSHTMADRFTYVPVIGIFIAVVWGASEVLDVNRSPKWLRVVLAVLVLGACAVRTRDQLRYWNNSATLFGHSVAVSQDNIVALSQLGIRLSFEGRSEEAIECFNRALRLNPGGLQVRYNLGNALAATGRYAEAITNFELVVKGMPGHYEAQNNLAQALVELGRLDQAAEHYRLALQYKPDEARIHKSLADVLGASGKLDEAAGQYRLALKEEPTDADTHYSLGITLAVQGKWEEAIQHYSETVRLAPTNSEAQYNLGYALRTRGRLGEAALHLNEALRLNPRFALAHYNLGCVLADTGRIREALAHLREALRLKPDYEEARQKLRQLAATPKEEDGK
jgi:tetratricopeptide (TPR) repeat protein